MATPPAEPALSEEARRAGWHELFFDLVFVAAVAALAGVLHEDPSPTGLAVFAALFVPVWWAWRGYTWYAAAFDAGATGFRLALLGAMAAAGALAAGVDGAAHRDSTTFAVAAALLFGLLAALYANVWRTRPPSRPHALRYTLGNAAGATLWLASLTLGEGERPLVWVVAMFVLVAPALAVLRMPYRGFADAGHIAERYGLFTIIVLGESVVRTIEGLAPPTGAAVTVVALAGFVIAAAIWWLYFARFRAMPDVSRSARFVWAQAHVLVFAGIAAAAVGVQLMVEAARLDVPPGRDERLPLGVGLAAYLAGMAVIRAATRSADGIVLLRVFAAGLAVVLAVADEGLGAVPVTVTAAAIVAGEAVVELRRAAPAGPDDDT